MEEGDVREETLFKSGGGGLVVQLMRGPLMLVPRKGGGTKPSAGRQPELEKKPHVLSTGREDSRVPSWGLVQRSRGTSGKTSVRGEMTVVYVIGSMPFQSRKHPRPWGKRKKMTRM